MGLQKQDPDATRRAKRLRRKPTAAEARLWRLLRRLEGYHFRRQVPIGHLVYDFGEHGCRLLIELDGGIHNRKDVQTRDAAKDLWARSRGYRVVHVPNDFVFGDGEAAVAMVMLAARSADWPPNSPSG